jgi:hypothetical protein
MADIITNLNEGAAGLADFKEELGAAIEEKGVAVDPEQPLTTYVDRVRAIPAADGDYVTNAELEAKGYITDTELEGKGYVTDTDLEGKGYVTDTELEGKDYITNAELGTKDYVTNADLEGKDYVTNADLENLPMGGGNPIGSIFSYPSARPPEGAYLLDGQTIYNCRETYKEFWAWLQEEIADGYIQAITAGEYEDTVAQYGICGAFVVSENDVRLPTWKGYQTPLGDSVPVKGNGMTLGLTNGTDNAGLNASTNATLYSTGSAYGKDVGSIENTSSTGIVYSMGVTTDPTKSGIIADTSNYPQDGFHWCIQVFNAATELSTQESAQLASQMQMKAQTDLANVSNPVQAFKTMAISWGMPDYTAGISVSVTTLRGGYTAPADGVLYIQTYTGTYGGIYKIYVNGVETGLESQIVNSGEYRNFVVMWINKNDTVSGVFGNDGIYSMYYPLKGADK